MRVAACAAAVAAALALIASALTEQHRPQFLPSSLDRPEPPRQRIASLTFSADEIVLGLVGPARIVGLTWLAADPESSHLADLARLVPPVRRVQNVEALIDRRPDLLVVDEFNSPDAVMLLSRAGLNVFRIRMPRSIEDIRSNIRQLGFAAGEPEGAAKMIAEIERACAQVVARTAGRTRPRVMGVSYGMWVNAAGTIVDDLIRLAGGENVVRERLPFGGFEPTAERLLDLDPEVVVSGGSIVEHPAMKRSRARVVVLPMKLTHPPSQFVAQAVRAWGKAVHPE